MKSSLRSTIMRMACFCAAVAFVATGTLALAQGSQSKSAPAAKKVGEHSKSGDMKATGSEAKRGGEENKVMSVTSYPLGICVVSGEKLGSKGEPVIKDYDGQDVKFCCAGCIGKFEANKAEYLKKLDDAVIAAQKADYPLTTCVVSGETLGGAMGEPVDYVHENRLVRFCCNGCKKDFQKEPAKYLAKIDQAVVDRDTKEYPIGTCVVSDETLGDHGDPISVVYNNRLVQLCCKGCVKDFKNDPAKYMAKLDSPNQSGAEEKKGESSEEKHADNAKEGSGSDATKSGKAPTGHEGHKH